MRSHYDVFASMSVHEEVLRPILASAEECLVYGISEDSRIFQASSSILQRDKGRHRLVLSGDPICGHELLWNAHGGERGSIVILMDPRALDAQRIFPHCYFPYVYANPGACHTPAALRLARKAIHHTRKVALVLPRNNGIEWMEVFAPSEMAVELFQLSWRLRKT
ncbi:MAG: hypothetical protein JNN07_00755 [Verrucomicrobiales bacterium]|nr:hypothetical protein [Verrucomicrobiales bacterium]